MVLGLALELAVRVTWWTVSTTTATIYYYAFGKRSQQKLIREKEEKEVAMKKRVDELEAEVKELKQIIKQK